MTSSPFFAGPYERAGIYPDSSGVTPSLFEFVPPVVPHGASIEQRFEAFHDANPWVYDELVRMAREAHRAGRERIGIAMLFEVLRWRWTLHTTDPSSKFKLNNSYRSRYARRIMGVEHDLAEIFDTRELKS